MPMLYYEHHITIRKDKLCPFRVVFVENAHDCVCNWHKNIELILITKGSGVFQYGSRKLHFREGELIIVNSGTLHGLSSEGGVSYYYLIIDESFCVENGITTDSRVFTRILRCEETVKLFHEAAQSLSRYAANRGSRDGLMASKVRLAVLALLIDLCEHHSKQEPHREKTEKPAEEYVKKVIACVADNYKEALTLDALAEMCGITKCHLAREFKRYTGQTVLTYLNTVRCTNAEVCLAGGMSVTETTYECGFESVSYFSRTYKKIMGASPSAALKR